MPITLMTIDETSGQQKDDTTLGLPTPLQTAIGSLVPIEKAVSAPGVLTFGANVIDVSFTPSGGAPLFGVNSNLSTTNGTPIYLYSSTTNNNIVFGRAGIDPDGSGGPQPFQADPAGAMVFAIYLDTGGNDVNATSAKIWVVQLASMYEPVITNPDDVGKLTGVLNVTVNTLTPFPLEGAPSGQNLFLTFGTPGDGIANNGIGDNNVAIVVTGKAPANQSGADPNSTADDISITTGDTVNTGQGGGSTTIGNSSQMVNPDKGLYFTFVKDTVPTLTVNTVDPKLDQNEADLETNIQFSSLANATVSQFQVVQLQGAKAATLKITALTTDYEPGAGFIDGLGDADDHIVALKSVTITTFSKTGNTYTANTPLVFNNPAVNPGDDPAAITLGGRTVDFQADGTAVISGVGAKDTIEYSTGTTNTQRVLIDNVGNTDPDLAASFDIGGFIIKSGVPSTSPLDDIAFADDGPTAGGTAQSGVVDEDGGLAGGIAGGPGDHATATTVATGSISAIFTPGADGLGGFSLASAGTSSLPTTLTSQGGAVVYDVTGNTLTAYVDDGTHTGYQAAEDREVYTLALSGTNNATYTFTLMGPLDHPGTDDPDVTGTQTAYEDDILLNLGTVLQVSDGDGDTATAAANKLVIDVDDDSPTATGGPVTGTVDEDGGLTGGNSGGPGDDLTATTIATGSVTTIFSGGADGVASYGLSSDTSGLSSTLKSQGGTIVYNVAGNTLTAYVESGAHTGYQEPEDREVFSLALNSATGAYTFTLLDQMDHPATDNPATTPAVETSWEDEIALNLGSILQVTDKDGDKVTAAGGQLVISVDDDSPNAFTPTSVSLDNTGTDSDTKALGTTGTIGADDPGTAKFVDTNVNDNYLYASDGVTKLTSGTQNIVLSGFGTTTLTAKTETSLLTVFTATLDMSTDQYTITFLRTLDDGSVPTSLLGAAPVRSGNPTYNLIDNVAGTDLDLLFSGATNGVQTTVNVSTNGAGTGNQTMNAGEMLRIDFTKDAALAGSPNGSDFVMGTHKNVNDFAFLISQNTPSGDHSTGTVLIKIYDANNDKIFTNDSLDTITKVKYNSTVIYDGGVSTDVVDVNGNTVHAIGVDTNNDSVLDSVVVTGLNEGKSGDGTGGDDPMITVHAATTYNRVEMTNYAGQTVGGNVLGGTDFDIAPAGVFQGTVGNQLSFSLPVQSVDYDGDTSPVELIGVTMVPVPLA